MFSQVWRKYFPVIIILMKRATQEGQVLSMNQTDFKGVMGSKKMKTSFAGLCLHNAKLQDSHLHSPTAKEFAKQLQEHDQIGRMLLKQHFEFSMNNNFQLTILNNTPAEFYSTALEADEEALEEAI
jgi:hypothetical protein